MLVIADQRKSFPKKNKLSEAKIKMLSCSDTVHNPKTFPQSQMLASASSAGMSQLTLEQLLKICLLKTESEQFELGSSESKLSPTIVLTYLKGHQFYSFWFYSGVYCSEIRDSRKAATCDTKDSPLDFSSFQSGTCPRCFLSSTAK